MYNFAPCSDKHGTDFYRSFTGFEQFGEWRSPVAHLVWDQRVAGSNPVSPTKPDTNCVRFFYLNLVWKQQIADGSPQAWISPKSWGEVKKLVFLH